MSIKTTKHVSREWAIDRIKLVYGLAIEKKYRSLESVTSENRLNLQSFVDNLKLFDILNIEEWTNTMLENKLDEDFYRESIFDNYIVKDYVEE